MRLTNRIPVVCLGDSHIKVFGHIIAANLIPHARFDVFFVPGATAQGIANPRSQTDALQAFQSRLEKARPWQPIVIQLGEVDCGFVIWYRAAKYNVPVEDQLALSINNYMSFLEDIQKRGWKEIYVLSAPLPTIKDGQDWGKIANARREVQCSQLERTQITLRYNAELEKRCREKGLHFVDVTTEQLDAATSLVAARFLATNLLDHHLENKPYGEYVARELAPLLAR